MFKILRFLGKYKNKALLGLLFKFLAAILELTIPLIMAYILTHAATLSVTNIVLLCGSILVIVFINFGLDITCQYFAALSSAGIGQSIRTALIENISSLSYKELDKLGTATLITRTTSDVNAIQQATAMGIRLLSRAPFLAIGAIFMALLINFSISIIFLAVIIIVFVVVLIIRKKTVPMYAKTQVKLDDITSLTKENLEGSRVSRAFNMQNSQKENFHAASVTYKKSILNVNKIASLLNPAITLFINLGIVAVVFVGGLMVGKNLIKEDIFTLVSYLAQVLIALNVISMLIVLFTKAEASAKRIEEVLAATSSLTYPTNLAESKEQRSCDNEIEFRNVSFSYGNAKNSLVNIDLSIQKGERVGIIGGTGQGKTTLINLIPRFYDVTEGEILLNGKNIKNWTKQELNSYISLAPQKPVLLNGTIGDNIRIGKIDATLEELEYATTLAEAVEFVKLDAMGFDKTIEQVGHNFSGGQKQRLSLARAFIKPAQILIIDDSLSALDMLTDKRVRANIDQAFAKKTVILVSQRVSTLKNCDRIIVLHHGKIVEMGTHQQLMSTPGTYREIAVSQSGK